MDHGNSYPSTWHCRNTKCFKITCKGNTYQAHFKDGSICSIHADLLPQGRLDRMATTRQQKLLVMTEFEACTIAKLNPQEVYEIDRDGPSFTFYLTNGQVLKENMILAMN